MPKPFPVLDDQMGWASVKARIGTPAPADEGTHGRAEPHPS